MYTFIGILVTFRLQRLGTHSLNIGTIFVTHHRTMYLFFPLMLIGCFFIVTKRYSNFRTPKLHIGIGRSLTTLPSHTTQHTGPNCAVRLIRQVQLQGNESPSEAKCLSGKAIFTHLTLLIRHGPLRAQPVVSAKFREIPRFRSSRTRVLRFFHCFQTNARSRRLIQ